MYNVMKEHLGRGGYRLCEAQEKINKLWIMGSLTDEQRDELHDMARGNAAAANEVDVMAKLAELEGRIRVLEEGGAAQQPGETYQVYVPGKWYYAGDLVLYEEKEYICTAPDGMVCVWSPTTGRKTTKSCCCQTGPSDRR